VLTGQADMLADAIDAVLAAQPMGSVVIEAGFKRERMVLMIEVLSGVPGQAIGAEGKLSPTSGAGRLERERLSAEDAAALAGFTRALGGQAAIGYSRAMAAALRGVPGEVTKIEIGTLGARPIYEVKVQAGSRVRSVKVHAVTGAILQS
jgi:hypothetical protein